jgi:hypothetical protein
MRYHEVEIDRGRDTFAIRNKYRFVRKIGSGAYGTVCSVINIYTGDGKTFFFLGFSFMPKSLSLSSS